MLPALVRNPVSVIGMVITTVMATLFAGLLLFDVLGFLVNPYAGLLVYVVVPLAFALGLLLIPIGVWWHRRRRRLDPQAGDWPVVDLGVARVRTIVAAVLGLTIVNLVIVSLGAYGALHHMETAEFCGTTCHVTMEPQWVAYQEAPHARVPCVRCHVGSGAGALVRSKLAGTRQLFQILTNNVPTPVPSPTNLRPARDTCEQCHWPEKLHGDKVKVIREFADDEQNSETATTLQVHVGGGSEKLGIATGIHWHMNVANEIEYIATDDKRDVIPYVRLKDRAGRVKEYVVEGVTPAQLAAGERRTMDCMDCHNRPSHPFAPSAERAVDDSMARGEISVKLPFAKRETVAALKGTYPDQQAASNAIAARLRDFYRANYLEIYKVRGDEVERAVSTAQRLYRRNVFPAMKVGWGTYPNNIGHVAFPGCFRCHDENHKANDGTVIRQECELCHAMP